MTWCCYSLVVVVLGFPCLYFALYVVRQSRWVHKRAPHWVRASPLSPLVTTIKKYSRKNRRFQLRSLHTTHAFPCTPITKDAKNYVLQDCLGDLVLFFHNCCGFGLPVPLFLLYRVVRQSCWVHKRAPHWVRASPAHHIIILRLKNFPLQEKSTFLASFSAHEARLPCTPISKDVETYCLQDCLGDFVYCFYIIVVVLGFTVPLLKRL